MEDDGCDRRGDLPVDGEKQVPVTIRSDEVPVDGCDDHRIGAGPELGVGEGDGRGISCRSIRVPFSVSPSPTWRRKFWSRGGIEGPGAHHLADDPHPIPGLPPQEGDRLQDRAERGLLEDRLGIAISEKSGCGAFFASGIRSGDPQSISQPRAADFWWTLNWA